MITLKTLPQATAQEVFDQCTKHLLTQNKKSTFSSLYDFKYHHRDLKCAAGCFISKDEYHPKIENKTWEKLISDGYAPKLHSNLIESLMLIHDNCNERDWPRRLTNLAKQEKLTANFPNIQP